jgi:ADP-ribose pyrophosphatase YjhB (NUDIX family)
MKLPTPVRAGLLRLYGDLPGVWRRRLVTWGSPRYTLGTLLVLFDAQRRVLLLRQRHGPGWTLPGGLLEKYEAPEQAAVRELLEETGIQIEASKLIAHVPNAVIHPRLHWVDFIFIANLTDAYGRAEQDDPDVIEAEWFPLSSLPSGTWNAGLIRAVNESGVGQ